MCITFYYVKTVHTHCNYICNCWRFHIDLRYDQIIAYKVGKNLILQNQFCRTELDLHVLSNIKFYPNNIC